MSPVLQADVPVRTLEQRMAAIQKANRIRVARAQTKRSLREGRLSILAVLTDPWPEVENMKVADVIQALPKHGVVKTSRLMIHLRVSHSKTIGGLSDRQRGELVAHFKGDRP